MAFRICSLSMRPMAEALSKLDGHWPDAGKQDKTSPWSVCGLSAKSSGRCRQPFNQSKTSTGPSLMPAKPALARDRSTSRPTWGQGTSVAADREHTFLQPLLC